jgi:basic membrane protein A and related proteins
MGKSRRFSALAIAASLAVVAAACGSDEDNGSAATSPPASAETTTAASTPAGGSEAPGGAKTCEAGTPVVGEVATETADGAGKTVGLMYDVTGRGDKSFNDAAAAGLDKAKADFGIEGVESTPAADNSDRPDRIKQVAEGPSELVVAVGFLWQTDVTQAAKDYPDKNFALVDAVAVDDNGTPDDTSDDKPLPNVRNIVFAEEQGSFLVGVAAACASKTGKIGFIGGVETDLIKKFEAGFTAGVQYVNPDATVEVKYLTQPPDFTGFNDATKGKSTAAAMYASGIDVIYAAAGGSGKGMFEAAVDAGAPGDVWAIGVDSDQYQIVDDSQKPYVLTSMLKLVDLATYQAIADELNGNFAPEIKTYDLKAGGIGYSASNSAINDYAGTIEKAKADIIAGTIVVPTTPGS